MQTMQGTGSGEIQREIKVVCGKNARNRNGSTATEQ